MYNPRGNGSSEAQALGAHWWTRRSVDWLREITTLCGDLPSTHLHDGVHEGDFRGGSGYTTPYTRHPTSYWRNMRGTGGEGISNNPVGRQELSPTVSPYDPLTFATTGDMQTLMFRVNENHD
jgi:hypothetical protein